MPELAGEGPVNRDWHQRLEYLAPQAFFANQTATVLWRYDGVLHQGNRAMNLMLDRYTAYRLAGGEPVTAAEFESVRRHLAGDLGEQHPGVVALAARGRRAPPRPVSARTAIWRSPRAIASARCRYGAERMTSGPATEVPACGSPTCWLRATGMATRSV